MKSQTRQETIINYLRVKPQSFGEVETEIVVGDKEPAPIKRQLIEATLEQQGANLIPIIIRHLPEPDEDENEYEAIYGGEWVQIAKEMGVDRLHAWIMDVSDDQIPEIQETMRMLA